jgi:hypothetical protein
LGKSRYFVSSNLASSVLFLPLKCRYIPVENVPVSYGGLKREDDSEIYGDGSGVLEQVVKANSVENIEIPLPQVYFHFEAEVSEIEKKLSLIKF